MRCSAQEPTALKRTRRRAALCRTVRFALRSSREAQKAQLDGWRCRNANRLPHEKSLEGLKRGRGEASCSARDVDEMEFGSTNRGGRSLRASIDSQRASRIESKAGDSKRPGRRSGEAVPGTLDGWRAGRFKETLRPGRWTRGRQHPCLGHAATPAVEDNGIRLMELAPNQLRVMVGQAGGRARTGSGTRVLAWTWRCECLFTVFACGRGVRQQAIGRRERERLRASERRSALAGLRAEGSKCFQAGESHTRLCEGRRINNIRRLD
ncbi:hypothetical protein V8C35DRAFT_11762 [Trichoderma chlorosporum]